MNTTTIQMEDTLEMMACMRRQEERGYVTIDWVRQSEQRRQQQQQQQQILVNNNNTTYFCANPQDIVVDRQCRERTANWCLQVVDFCKFKRETAEIAMSYLDRFVAIDTDIQKDLVLFQLASMAALYTAIKIHEPTAVTPSFIASLSHGAVDPEDVEEMESDMLDAIEWRVNPPTSMSFVRLILDLIPVDILNEEMRQHVLNVAQLQTELTIADYKFVPVHASTIAFGAMMNALESVIFDERILAHVAFALGQALQLDGCSMQVCNAQAVLFEKLMRLQNQLSMDFVDSVSTQHQQLLQQQQQQQLRIAADPLPKPRRGSIEISPRAVVSQQEAMDTQQ